jgi:uncharacterized pyridoxamine 5'-phosphate oxidase family protein
VLPERCLTAGQVCRYLQSTRHLALATVTREGAPRVMPVDGFMVHGRFIFSSSIDSARFVNLRRDPRCSATHFVGDEFMVTVHGHAELVNEGAEFAALDELFLQTYGLRATEIGPPVTFARIEPERMYAWATHPENYPPLDS